MSVNLFIFDIRQFPAADNIDNIHGILKYCIDENRIKQFHARDDRCRALASDLIIRRICQDDPQSFRRVDESGHPIKPCHPKYLFNVSHDDDFVIAVQSPSHAVGVDIMKIKPSSPKISVSEMLDNLRDIFTVEEWKYINLHPEDRLRRFYHVWTAKEAYVKTIGTGLYTEPQCVSVDGLIEDVYHPRIAHAGNTDKSFKFTTHISESIIEEYVVAICAGPLEDCDKSWSKFCSSREAVPTPVKLCSVVELKLEDLVSLYYPQCGHRDTERGIFK